MERHCDDYLIAPMYSDFEHQILPGEYDTLVQTRKHLVPDVQEVFLYRRVMVAPPVWCSKWSGAHGVQQMECSKWTEWLTIEQLQRYMLKANRSIRRLHHIELQAC